MSIVESVDTNDQRWKEITLKLANTDIFKDSRCDVRKQMVLLYAEISKNALREFRKTKKVGRIGVAEVYLDFMIEEFNSMLEMFQESSQTSQVDCKDKI